MKVQNPLTVFHIDFRYLFSVTSNESFSMTSFVSAIWKTMFDYHMWKQLFADLIKASFNIAYKYVYNK